jgi:hypothetical protein
MLLALLTFAANLANAAAKPAFFASIRAGRRPTSVPP